MGLAGCLNIWRICACLVPSFRFGRKVEGKICSCLTFCCQVTWPAFGKLLKCRISVGSFSPIYFLCGDFFVWRFVIKNFTLRVWAQKRINLVGISYGTLHSSPFTCIGPHFHIYLTYFTFWYWGVQFFIQGHHFVNCVFVENLNLAKSSSSEAPPPANTVGHNFLQA